MSEPGSNIISSVRRFVSQHKPLFIWGALYIAAVVVGLFYTPWESRMVDDLVGSGNNFFGLNVNIIEMFFPGPYDLLSFFFIFIAEKGKPNIVVVVAVLLVLSAEMILEKVITKKYYSDVKLIEKFFISFFSSNVIFSLTAHLFVLICPLLEALPDMSDSIIFKIITIAALVLFIPVILHIVLFLCSFMLCVYVAALLSVNHVPVFLIWIAVLVLAFVTDWLSTKISEFIGRIVWSIIPFLRPLAELLRDD